MKKMTNLELQNSAPLTCILQFLEILYLCKLNIFTLLNSSNNWVTMFPIAVRMFESIVCRGHTTWLAQNVILLEAMYSQICKSLVVLATRLDNDGGVPDNSRSNRIFLALNESNFSDSASTCNFLITAGSFTGCRVIDFRNSADPPFS